MPFHTIAQLRAMTDVVPLASIARHYQSIGERAAERGAPHPRAWRLAKAAWHHCADLFAMDLRTMEQQLAMRAALEEAAYCEQHLAAMGVR